MHDVVIVGAGVAGSIVGRLLGRHGFNVRLVDMTPAYTKPCGEVVPTSLIGMLSKARLEHPSVVDKINFFQFYDAGGRLVREVGFNTPVWHSIDKSGWVNNLREGMELARGAVKDLGSIKARIVVDARGPFASRGLKVVVWRGYARTRDFEGRAAIILSRNPFGIAWIFGHGDEANVGGGFLGIGEPRRLSMRLLQRHGVTRVEGDAYSLVTLYPRLSLGQGSVIRVGEAAGFVQSLGGEGIRPAVESAIELARAIVDGGEDILQAYTAATRGLQVEVRLANLLLDLSRALGAKILGYVERGFFDLWLRGRLRESRLTLSRLAVLRGA